MNIIKAENLIKKYDKLTAVNGVSFTIEKGELFGLLGPNGAGKSTTISVLTGLIKPTDGSISINGIDVLKNPMEAKSLIGLVPQDIALYPTLTAEENLRFWGRMYNLSGKLLKERMNEVIEIAGLKDRRKEKIQNYSGGMKRRINIAAALMHRPEILIMDEPTVGIDPQSRNHILECVKNLNEGGMTVIYTSHYMEEVEYLCSRLGIIDHGKLIALGNKEELKRSVMNKDKIEMELSSLTPAASCAVKAIEEVAAVRENDNKLTIYSKGNAGILANVISAVSSMNVKVLSVKVEEPNLESVFLNLTGRALRD